MKKKYFVVVTIDMTKGCLKKEIVKATSKNDIMKKYGHLGVVACYHLEKNSVEI